MRAEFPRMDLLLLSIKKHDQAIMEIFNYSWKGISRRVGRVNGGTPPKSENFLEKTGLISGYKLFEKNQKYLVTNYKKVSFP